MYYSNKFIKEYLHNDIQKSIENDVKTAIKGYSELWIKETREAGFFAIPRLLFPEIDGLGSYITGNSNTTTINIKSYLSMVMSQIDDNYKKYAGFITIIFRHGLLHQHAPKKFRYNGKTIGWAIQVGSPNLPISALRKSHLIFSGSHLWIHANVFCDDLIKSIDLFEPLVIQKYREHFIKSYREQNRKLSIHDSIRPNVIERDDFNFLKDLK